MAQRVKRPTTPRGLRAKLAWRWLGRLLLTLLALACAALALGAFASLNAGAPLWLRTLSLPESLLGAYLPFAPFERALAESLLAALLVYWAAEWPRPVA